MTMWKVVNCVFCWLIFWGPNQVAMHPNQGVPGAMYANQGVPGAMYANQGVPVSMHTNHESEVAKRNMMALQGRLWQLNHRWSKSRFWQITRSYTHSWDGREARSQEPIGYA